MISKLAWMAAAGVIATAGLCAAFAPPARAEVQYPWCAKYQPPLDATNCGFNTYQQCLATISGIGGFCYQNPAYPPPRGRAPRR
jgi:hypothetical protein